ncbi:MAG: sugar porter family MFS transporter [Halieaceae bacterium]|nr:sugar porter family MFS transporter [Halieaceae bacterium]
MDNNNKHAHTLRIALAVSLGGFVFGFDASVISGAVRFVAQDFNLGDLQMGLLVGAPTLGGILSASCAGPLSDLYGRRTLLLILAALYVLSAGFSAFAPNYEVLMAARAIGGLAFASLAMAPIYISEIASARSRGRMVAINQFNIVLGLSAAYFVNFVILRVSGLDAEWVRSLGIAENTWRWMLGFELLPAVLWLLLMLRLPESPRWLIINGREAEGRKVLENLELDSDLETEIADIRHSAHGEIATLGARIKDVFSPRMRFALVIGLILSVIQQITGVNAIYFYAPTVFEQSGIGTDAAFAQAVAVGLTNVVFTIVSMLLIDRLGRKPLLIIGLSGIAVSMMVCAVSFNNASYALEKGALDRFDGSALEQKLTPLEGRQFEDDVALKAAISEAVGEQEARKIESELIQAAIQINPQVVLFGILLFVASFAVSLGPVMWVMLPEIFPNKVRGVAMAVTGVVNSGVSFGVQFLFPWQLTNLGVAITLAGYAGFAIIGLILVMWLVPETRGKTLEELEEELTGAQTA